jgi:hypothetical protein
MMLLIEATGTSVPGGIGGAWGAEGGAAGAATGAGAAGWGCAGEELRLHAETAAQTVSTHAIRTTSDLIRRNSFTANRFARSIRKRPGRINSAGTLRHQTIRAPAPARAHPVLQVLPALPGPEPLPVLQALQGRPALPGPEPLPVLQALQVLPGRPAQDCFGCKQPKPTPQPKR